MEQPERDVSSNGSVDANSAAAALPATAKDNIGLLTDLYQQEHADASPAQSVLEAVSTAFGSPAYFLFVLAFVAAWIAYNQLGHMFGLDAFDEAPFFWLQGLIALNALLLTVAVLIRQNRMAILAQQRAHLDLQINLLAEHKITKVIQMLERNRNGDAAAGLTSDNEVEQLTTPADAHAMLTAIKKE